MNWDALPFRLERRLQSAPRWLALATPLVSVSVALALAAAVLAISGHSPLATYRSMVEAALTRTGAFSSTLLTTTPLLFTGLAAAFAFRMKAWNIGGEGQLYIGAVAAAGVGFALDQHGLWVALPAMLAASIMGGALWAAVPGLLRAYLNANEILTSLMLNYVAGLLMMYLIFDSSSYWRDTSSVAGKVFPQSKVLAPGAYWPVLTGGWVAVPLGIVIGLVLAILLYATIRHTPFGFQLRVISDSPAAGRYAGMHTRRVFVIVMMISGALAGLAGASQVGFSHLLDPNGLQQAQYGYTGIVVAALARYNPLGVLVSALFLGVVTNAGFDLQGATFPPGLLGTIEGILLFCVLGGDILLRYRVTRRIPRHHARVGAASQPSAATLGAGDATTGGTA